MSMSVDAVLSVALWYCVHFCRGARLFAHGGWPLVCLLPTANMRRPHLL